MATANDKGNIYILTSKCLLNENYVFKIGKSKKVKERLCTLNTGHWNESTQLILTNSWYVENYSEIEKY